MHQQQVEVNRWQLEVVWVLLERLRARLTQSVEHEALNLRVMGLGPSLVSLYTKTDKWICMKIFTRVGSWPNLDPIEIEAQLRKCLLSFIYLFFFFF